MLQIEILNGSEAGQLLSLSPGTTTLGRRKDADLPLNSIAVSGRHLELKVSDSDSVHFRDLGSTNGTWAGGMKVQEGEWSLGATLKLGDLELRLVGSSTSANRQAVEIEIEEGISLDAGASQAARQQAMSAKRKGGPLLVLSMVAAIGAGGAWWFFSSPAASTAGGDQALSAKGPQIVLDAIDNLGDFREDVAADWQLPATLTITDGKLRFEGGQQRVHLARQFDLDGGGLRLVADVDGLKVVPVIGWGFDDAETPSAWWRCSPLTAQGVELALPEQADWFELALLIEGSGTLGPLHVEPTDASAAEVVSADRKWIHSGGNLILSRLGRELMHTQGAGTWSEAEGGLQWQGASDAGLWLRFTDRVLETGLVSVLADGGPIEIVKGASVESSPGFFVGADAQRMIVRWDTPAQVKAIDGGLRVQSLQARLIWDSREELGAASKADRLVHRTVRDRQSAELLAASATLLRDYPFSDAHVEYAKSEVDKSIQFGRTTLSQLKLAAGEATFLRSVREMKRIETSARELAANYPGTSLSSDATILAQALQSDASVISADQRAVRQRWRDRLQSALNRTYPQLGAWLINQEKQS